MQKTAYKETRAYSSVHKKLMSAIAMLLIASILMVSSTYAWFTLSTAPEVTGITTTVGANGALEIALRSDVYDSADLVPSATGDSGAATQDMTKSNITWGNLVDLSADDYGFSEITLNLAAYNSKARSLADILSYPTYGADGRVNTLQSALTVAAYGGDTAGFSTTESTSSATSESPLPSYYGVRALGVASSTSVYATVLSSQKSVVKSAVTAAKKYVPNALDDNILTFAQFAQAYSNDSSTVASATYMSLVDDLIEAMESTVTKMETAMSGAILAYVATDKSLYDSYYSTLKSLEFENLYSAASGYSAVPSSVSSVYSTYSSLKSAAETARTSYAALVQGTATLADLKTTLAGLVNLDALGCTLDGAETALGAAATALINGSGTTLVITIESGGGAFYDLATMIGNYTVTYSLSGITATLTTAYDGTAALDTLNEAVSDMTAAESTGSESTMITDFYGYCIDFWFRTNATGTTNLNLQTKAATRIYGEDDDSVQGAGSYVQFGTGTDEDLAKAVKLVFVDETENILATASITSIDSDGKGWLELDSGSTITTLSQNTGKAVSVVVYLDGENVTNADVNPSSTVSFTLNLQFSTDTTLTPMTYSSGYAELPESDTTPTPTPTTTPTGAYTISGSGNYTLNATSADEGDEITVSPAAGYTITSVTGSYNDGNGSLTGTANGDGSYSFNMPAYDVTLTVVTEENQTAATTYSVTTVGDTYATVVASPSTAAATETVTITVTLEDGYEVDTISAVDGDNGTVNVDGSGTSYTLTMPASDVTVTVTSKAV